MQQIKVWMYINAFNNEYGEELFKADVWKGPGQFIIWNTWVLLLNSDVFI